MKSLTVSTWPEWTRTAAWSSVASLLLFRVALSLLDLDWRMELALADGVTYLAPMVIVFGLLILLGFHTAGTAEHVLWRMMAPALGLVLLSETYWTWYALSVDPHGPPQSTPLYLLHFTAVALFLSVVLRMTRFGKESLGVRIKIYLDTLGGICIIFPFIYLGWTYPVIKTVPQLSSGAAVTYAIYPIAALLMLVGVTVIFVGSKVYRWHTWERLIAGSLVIYAIGLAAIPVWYPTFLMSHEFGPSWFTTLLGLGHALMGVGAVYRLSARPNHAMHDSWQLAPVELRSERIIHPVVMTLALPLLGWFALANEDPAVSQALLATTALLAFALVARGLVSDFMRTRNLNKDAADGLSWPLNRSDFDSCLWDAIHRTDESGGPLSVIVITSTGGAAFNATLGLSARDQALTGLLTALRETGGDAPSIFRLCADQFAVVCEGVSGHDAATTARRVWLLSRRDSGASEDALELFSGVVAYPEHGLDVYTLLTAAQSACLQASLDDGEPVVLYDDSAQDLPHDLDQRVRMRTMREAIGALARAVDARDPDARDHSEHVSELAMALAQVLDLPDERVRMIGLAALMHDVGKVGVRDELLQKRTSLTDSELEEVAGHVVLGAMILAPISIDGVVPAVRHHHERWDGTGYPDGLSAHAIPLEARILAICDTFERLSSSGQPSERADINKILSYIESGSGRQFDPVIVSVFVRLIRGFKAPGAHAGIASSA